jgi:hypothetical protein
MAVIVTVIVMVIGQTLDDSPWKIPASLLLTAATCAHEVVSCLSALFWCPAGQKRNKHGGIEKNKLQSSEGRKVAQTCVGNQHKQATHAGLGAAAAYRNSWPHT